jgi:hypothetical protein
LHRLVLLSSKSKFIARIVDNQENMEGWNNVHIRGTLKQESLGRKRGQYRGSDSEAHVEGADEMGKRWQQRRGSCGMEGRRSRGTGGGVAVDG